MFPQKYKLNLRSKVDFFDEAQKLRIGLFTVFIRGTAEDSKLIVVVPKRTLALSSARNETKRVVYQQLARQIPRLSKLKLNIAIIVQRPIPSGTVDRLVSELVTNLERVTKT